MGSSLLDLAADVEVIPCIRITVLQKALQILTVLLVGERQLLSSVLPLEDSQSMRLMGSDSLVTLLSSSKLMDVCFKGDGGVTLEVLGDVRTLPLGGVLVLLELRLALEALL